VGKALERESRSIRPLSVTGNAPQTRFVHTFHSARVDEPTIFRVVDVSEDRFGLAQSSVVQAGY